MNIKTVAERLGGAAVLGREVHSDLELALVIREGLPYQVLEHVLQSGDLQADEAYALLSRNHSERTELTSCESDRLARAVELSGVSRSRSGIGRRLTDGFVRRTGRSPAIAPLICWSAMQEPGL